MSSKNVYLLKYRQVSTQRGHFSIYLPNGPFPGSGTLIHVVGAPMAGFQLQIRHNYELERTTQPYTSKLLGQVSAASATEMERLASTVPPPGISQNFMGPVDGVLNKRCQEWTMEYLQLLVQKHILDQSVIALVQAERDPPNHGVGLNPVAQGQAQVQAHGQVHGQAQSQGHGQAQGQAHGQAQG